MVQSPTPNPSTDPNAPPLLATDAIALLKDIPAIRVVWSDKDAGFVGRLLEQTAGLMYGDALEDLTKIPPPDPFPIGVRVYRYYMAGYLYLKQHPSIHRVTKHETTNFGDYASPLATLLELQAGQDTDYGILPPPGQEAIATNPQGRQPFRTMSVRKIARP